MDMFPDLPTQLAVASTSLQVALMGTIELSAEPTSSSTLFIPPAAATSADVGSNILLLLIVCMLFLLLGILLIPARLGICFRHRLCFPFARSAKSRRSRKLSEATKKALKKLPVKCLNQVDPLISEGFDQCAICIEIFKPSDIIRSLPCRHMYHRACIDPWLLKHRSCPLCKQNILIACGLPLTEEDLDSNSATTSVVNSAFSVSTAPSSPSISSISTTLERLFYPLLILFTCCRQRRHRHRRYYHRDFRTWRLSSSIDEVSPPSEGRRVLGSASENSSSSTTARSIPSDLLQSAAISPLLVKGARFLPEDSEGEDRESLEEVINRRRQHNFMICCSRRSGNSVGTKKEVLVGGSPSARGSALPPVAMYPPTSAHPSTMLLYHMPQSISFNSTGITSEAVLPSYEQATAMIPQTAFVALSSPPPSMPTHQLFPGWNPRFATDSGYQTAGILDLPSQHIRSSAKTNVVYAVLSAPTSRMSAHNGVAPTPLLYSLGAKLPVFVDVNTSGVTGALDGQRRRLFPSSSPPIIQARDPLPPAYSFATLAEPAKPTGTALRPLRRVARLTTHLFASPRKKRQQSQYHHVSFPGALKHHQQDRSSKQRLKPRPRRSHATLPSAPPTTMATSRLTNREHIRHRACRRVDVLAKTLELNHEGVIMSPGSRTTSATVSGSSPPQMLPLQLPRSVPGRANSQISATNSVSESSEEAHCVLLRHTRMRSVRVTVEPQAQWNMERESASCEGPHNVNLHKIKPENSRPLANSLPSLLAPSVATDVNAAVISVAAALCSCRSCSAPAICSSASTPS